MSRSCWYWQGGSPEVKEVQSVSVLNYSDWQLRVLAPGDRVATTRPDDWWLQPATRAFLQRYPQGMTTRGLALIHVPTGRQLLLTTQTFYFRVGTQVSDAAKGPTTSWDFRRRLLRPFRTKVLVLGQLLTSGDYGQAGLHQLSPAEAGHLLPAVAETLMQQQTGYRAVLLKDLFATDTPHTRALIGRGFTQLPTDPIMVLPLRWPDVRSYLADLSSKYRIRYRRARTKLEGIHRRQLSSQEVSDRIDRLYQLYRLTSQGAAVNLTALTPDYFRWLAGRARVDGYFTEARVLIGFTTALANGPVYQAHYLGLEPAYKYSHHLYHNMLFDLLADALEGDYETLDYGRTASEIKSSIGAVPRTYATLVRLRSPLLDRLIPCFTPAVFTASDWQQRHPFR